MQTTPPIARVHGELLHEAPLDLYIPPDALEVFLETFEGPLDLLLYLIKRQNLDILDIPIAAVTRQYIEYIERMAAMRMELAAEYLLMAAYLAEIKSRLLLPRPESAEAPVEDPRADLIERLQTYAVFKQAAQDLDALPRMERDVWPVSAAPGALSLQKRYPDLPLIDVLLAFREVLKRADQFTRHHIQREPLSVRERMSRVLECLQSAGRVAFEQLFDAREGRAGVVVALLAVLELAKEGLIELIQDDDAPNRLQVQSRTA